MTLVYVKQAFSAYKRNFTAVIGAILLAILVVLVLVVIALVPLGFSVINMVMNGITDTSALLESLTQSMTSLAFAAVFLLLAFVSGTALSVGISKVYADAIRGRARAMDIFPVARAKWLTALGASIAVIAIFTAVVLVLSLTAAVNALLATVLVAIAIAYLIASFAFVNVSIAVNNLKAIDAVKNSINFAKQNFLATIILVIGFLAVDYLLDYVPMVGGLISFLVVSPIFSLSLISLYLTNSKIKKTRSAKRKR